MVELQLDSEGSEGQVLLFPGDGREASLVEYAQRGDSQSQAQLYRLHASDFLAFLYRMCGSAHDAEDIAQEAFLITFRKIDRVQPGRFRAFLYGVGVRKCRHLFRRRSLLRRLGLDRGPNEQDIGRIAKPGASPDELAELALVHSFLLGLSADRRIAWVLRRLQGHTVSEAAKLCQCSPATLKRRVAAVEASLEDHLGEVRE